MKAWEATDPSMTTSFLVDLVREEQVRQTNVYHSSSDVPFCRVDYHGAWFECLAVPTGDNR